jgi:hypothetical protein
VAPAPLFLEQRHSDAAWVLQRGEALAPPLAALALPPAHTPSTNLPSVGQLIATSIVSTWKEAHPESPGSVIEAAFSLRVSFCSVAMVAVL